MRVENILMKSQRGRTCTPRNGQRSHMVSPNSLINCKKCHAAKCFRHILNSNVHSSEALLANAADSDSTIWHQLHLAARQRDVPSRLTQRQPVGIAEQLVFFAVNFSSTSPVNGETSVGFYDGRSLQVWHIPMVYTDQCSYLRQALARLESTRGEGETSDTSFQVLSSAPTTSSRSTVVPPQDKETSNHPSATAGHVHHPATEHEETDASSSRRRSKRPRDLETRDESEPLPKRIRLRRSSTRTLQSVTTLFVTLSLLSPHSYRPVRNPRLSLRKLLPPRHRRIHLNFSSGAGEVHCNLKKRKTRRSNQLINLPRGRWGLVRSPYEGGQQ